MDNLHVSSLIMGAFQRCRNSHYVESPKIPVAKSTDEQAVLKFLLQLEQAYQYQLSLRKAQRPKRKLPPVPKFEEDEVDEPQKKVQILPENKPEINVLAKSSASDSEGNLEITSQIVHSTAVAETMENIKMEEEEQVKSDEQAPSDEKANVISQMNQMFDQKEKKAPVFVSNLDYLLAAENDKKDLTKFRKLYKCITELINKLEIKDASVPVYCREFLQLVVPQLFVHFNKKPFIAIAAAVLIFACYKADYHITTKKIIEASEAKETMVVKCFYSIKEILANKKNN